MAVVKSNITNCYPSEDGGAVVMCKDGDETIWHVPNCNGSKIDINNLTIIQGFLFCCQSSKSYIYQPILQEWMSYFDNEEEYEYVGKCSKGYIFRKGVHLLVVSLTGCTFFYLNLEDPIELVPDKNSFFEDHRFIVNGRFDLTTIEDAEAILVHSESVGFMYILSFSGNNPILGIRTYERR